MKIYIRAVISNFSKEPVEVRQEVALDPNTSEDILVSLSDDLDSRVRLSLLCNPNLPSYLVDKILDEGTLYFLEQVALCISIPTEILERLSTNQNALIRSRVAFNSETPPEILVKLAHDINLGVVWNVAGNKNAPVDVLTQLSTSTDGTTRMAVAENPNTPREVLDRLYRDPIEEVSLLARRNLNGF
jgi:hypothetical protein